MVEKSSKPLGWLWGFLCDVWGDGPLPKGSKSLFCCWELPNASKDAKLDMFKQEKLVKKSSKIASTPTQSKSLGF